MRLVQFIQRDGSRSVGRVDGDALAVLRAVESTYDLALEASRTKVGLAQLVAERTTATRVDYDEVEREARLLPPLDHPDPAHCTLSGTGLDHLGSAQARDAMHTSLQTTAEEELTDSMKMFRLGLEGGKPGSGQVGVAPEWFYKGDGRWLVPHGRGMELFPFAHDAGEEAELVGLYVIGDQGEVLRVGFALGNEFADHVLERQNYLYLAHSKLRSCSMGPELLVGEPPQHIEGTVRILREGQPLWSAPFLTGEANMTHTLANIEHHHFKYPQFRRPGDVHCHFYGTATLSFAAGVQAQLGDVFEISAPQFGRPLRNPLVQTKSEEELIRVHPL
jgi:hypothetical protein